MFSNFKEQVAVAIVSIAIVSIDKGMFSDFKEQVAIVSIAIVCIARVLWLYLLRLYLLQVPIEIIGGNCPEQNAFVAALYEKEHDKSLATARGLP